MGLNRRCRRSGSVIVEFAIGSSFFIALFVGTFQFGYTLFAYNNLASAVRAGARYGSLGVYNASTATVNSEPATTFVNAVKNVTVYGDPAGAANGATPVVAGLSTDNVRVDVEYTLLLPRTVTVSVVGYQVPAIFGSWTANRKPNATFTFVGRYAPPGP